MKLLALLPIAATALTGGDLTSVTESLRAIAVNAKKDGKQINQTTKNVVQAMVNAINNSLITALVVDKAAAQADLDKAEADVLACKTSRDSTFAGSIAAANTTQQGSQATFDSCKEADAELGFVQTKKSKSKHHHRHHDDPAGSTTTDNHDWGYNFSRVWDTNGELSHTSHESHAHSEEERLCRIVNQTVMGFAAAVAGYEPIATTDYCETPNPANWTDLYRTNDKLTNENKRLVQWFNHMSAFETNNAAKYKAEREACHLARSRHQIRVAECTRLQGIFENDFCAYANNIDETCHLYESCWDATYATYLVVNASVKVIEDQMKRQQHALEILTCYANEIMADSTDLSNCDDETATCQNCPDWDITYETPHAKIDCSEDQEDYRPCSDSWCTANFGKYFNSDTPVAQCTPCADPNLVAYSAPPESWQWPDGHA